MLTRRPDIQEVTFRYPWTNAEIGAASPYPKVTIPLHFGMTSSTLHQAFTNASP